MDFLKPTKQKIKLTLIFTITLIIVIKISPFFSGHYKFLGYLGLIFSYPAYWVNYIFGNLFKILPVILSIVLIIALMLFVYSFLGYLIACCIVKFRNKK